MTVPLISNSVKNISQIKQIFFAVMALSISSQADKVIAVTGGLLASTRGSQIYLFNDGAFVLLNLAGEVVIANMRKETLR